MELFSKSIIIRMGIFAINIDHRYEVYITKYNKKTKKIIDFNNDV